MGSQKAPSGYQPSNQQGADLSYQTTNADATHAGYTNLNSYVPQLQQIAHVVSNNPYFKQEQQGANAAAATGMNQVAPMQLQGAGALQGIGNADRNMISQATGGLQLGPEMLKYIMSRVPELTQGMGAANQVLNTGFDPQNALYDRMQQQTRDASNATNSMYGLSSSPYGAGVANQDQSNFNIDWQNQQLSRQIAALGAYGTEQGQVASNLEGLTGAATGDYNSLVGGAANNAATLTNAAGNAYQGASNLGVQGLQTMSTASQYPAAIYQQQQDQRTQAIMNVINGTNAAIQPIQQGTQNWGTYLGLGQSATANAQNAANINNHAPSFLGGAMGALGQVGAAVATGGMSSAGSALSMAW